MNVVKGITVHNNNKMSIILTKNMESQYQIQQINIQYHYIQKLVNKKEININKIPNTEMLTNGII